MFIAPSPIFILDLPPPSSLEIFKNFTWGQEKGWILCKRFDASNQDELERYLKFTKQNELFLSLDVSPDDLPSLVTIIEKHQPGNLILTCTTPFLSPIATYRIIAERMKLSNTPPPPHSGFEILFLILSTFKKPLIRNF